MKRFIRILALGLVTGIVLTVLQNSLQIDRQVFLRCFWVGAAVILVAVFAFNLIYSNHYFKKMRALIPLLDENRIDEYISGVEELLQQAKGKYIKTMLQLNLAVGYLDARRFQEGIELLESLPEDTLKGNVKNAYELNLCFAYFRSGRYDDAMEMYRDCEKQFIKFRTIPAYQRSVTILDTFADIICQRYDSARTQLEYAQSTWTDPRSQTSFYYLQTLLEEQLKGED